MIPAFSCVLLGYSVVVSHVGEALLVYSERETQL